jgi:predicted methyltransferase
MKKANLLALALLAVPLACTEATPPPVTPEPPPAETAAPVATPPPAETAAPAEPTPEEKKKAEAAKKLAEDRAQWEADLKVEQARWTPELHAAAKKLAESKHASLKASVLAAMKGPHRKPKNAERDAHRHPLETLEFFGMRPAMTVLDVGPGDGWYTELLAPTLAAKGKLIVTSNDPDGPAEARSTYYGQRLKGFLDMSPELYGKVEKVITKPPVQQLGIDGKLDMVLMFREMHGMHRDKLLPGFLTEVFKALKPGGVLGVEQHRAKADANPDESSKQGYLPEAFVIAQCEAAGFKLEKKSEINANPRDTKDYPEGVWTLPPSYQLKDKDHAKYEAIGESDRMTLKFVKPAKKK